MRRPAWLTDVLILEIFVLILAVLSAVTIRTLQESFEQTEKLQVVNQFVDCLDPTTKCGKKLAEQQDAEREFLLRSMRNQAVCTLLTSRTLRGEVDTVEIEQVYNQCVEARTGPAPPPPDSPVVSEEEEEEEEEG